MDDFSVVGDSFDSCLGNLCKVLQRCEETNLVLNWEKCHFMVEEGIVLGHKISGKGIEVDRAKVEVIERMCVPKSVKDVRSFLGHCGFYRRFIQDFARIAKPLTNLLVKDVDFDFSDDCVKSFVRLKESLVSAPILQPPDWSQPFEIMCDASDYAVGAVLGQRKDKKPVAICYASKVLDRRKLITPPRKRSYWRWCMLWKSFAPIWSALGSLSIPTTLLSGTFFQKRMLNLD